jgi:5-(carboxyamino)imidazole ribonucleotide synthase
MWFKENKLRDPDFNILLDDTSVNLHMYGKEEPRKGRKMAHFNVSGDNLKDLLVKASRLKQKLSN